MTGQDFLSMPLRRARLGAVAAAVAAGIVLLALAVPPHAGAAACPGAPLAGVQRPRQLTVLSPSSPCRSATGTVKGDHKEHDGDCHVNIALDPGQASLLNGANLSKAHGLLITEVIPKHALPIPRIGSHVTIFGTHVFDKATGWKELHPVWSIQVLTPGKGTTGTC